MQLVKITNISHESSQGATSAWIASRNLSPGMSIVVPVSGLPPDWERLGTIFKFEFMGVAETTQPELETKPQDQAGISLEMLEALMERVVSKHMAQVNQGPGITKEDLISTLKEHAPTQMVIQDFNHESSTARSVSGPSLGMFIPKIESVGESNIDILTSSEKVDTKSLKDRLKKFKAQ